MVTVVAAVLLLVIGLVLVFFQSSATDLIHQLPLSRDITQQIVSLMQEKAVAWAALALSSSLLIVGSMVRGL
jgi:hypothetical protein